MKYEDYEMTDEEERQYYGEDPAHQQELLDREWLEEYDPDEADRKKERA